MQNERERIKRNYFKKEQRGNILFVSPIYSKCFEVRIYFSVAARIFALDSSEISSFCVFVMGKLNEIT